MLEQQMSKRFLSHEVYHCPQPNLTHRWATTELIPRSVGHANSYSTDDDGICTSIKNLEMKIFPYQRHSSLLFFKKTIIEVYFGVKPIKPLRVQSRTSIASKNWLGQGKDLRVEQTDSSTLLLLIYSLVKKKRLFSARLSVYINTDKFSSSIGSNNSIKHAFHRITKTRGSGKEAPCISEGAWLWSSLADIGRIKNGTLCHSKSSMSFAYFIFWSI